MKFEGKQHCTALQQKKWTGLNAVVYYRLSPLGVGGARFFSNQFCLSRCLQLQPFRLNHIQTRTTNSPNHPPPLPPSFLPKKKRSTAGQPHAHSQEAKRRLTSKQKVETPKTKKGDKGKTTTKKPAAKKGATIAVVREALMHGHDNVDGCVGKGILRSFWISVIVAAFVLLYLSC